MITLGIAAAAAAQRPLVSAPLDSGTVVRVRLRAGGFEAGKLLATFGPDSTRLSYCRWPAQPCVAGGVGHVIRPTEDALGIEVHRGARAPRGTVIGGLVGVGFGMVYLKALEYGSEGPIESGERVRVVVKSAALCAIFGATIGGLFNRWVSAP